MTDDGEKLIFNYKKTNSYKTYYADGFFGGVTPKGKLYVEPFIERGATPKLVEHLITDSGIIDSGTTIEGKSDIIREIECGMIMDIETARSLHNWLADKIKEFEVIQNKIEEKH